MPLVHAFDPPERFVAGTVGPPGGRTFFLQASGEGRLVSVSLEKVQVSVLADRVNDLLDAHAEGWPVVGPALLPVGGPLERRRAARALGAWAPGGRNPRLDVPLLLPSLVGGLEPSEHRGLPAYAGEGLFEGRAVVRLPTRSGRPQT